MNRRSQNRLAILRRYLDAWAATPRHNRSIVAEIIVEKFDGMGLAEHLPGTGVEFIATEDHHHDMRVRGQKIWRWLGAYDETKAQPDRLFFAEQAIVAAMPEAIKIAYLGEVYFAADICVSQHQPGEHVSPFQIAKMLIKENSEAQVALVDLHKNSSREDIDNALQELKESEAATRAAITALEVTK